MVFFTYFNWKRQNTMCTTRVRSHANCMTQAIVGQNHKTNYIRRPYYLRQYKSYSTYITRCNFK